MRKLTYTTEFGGDYGEVSINLLEEESEKILGIRIDTMGPFYLRNDDIDELHDKIHECLEARETFAKLAAQGMGGWDEQPAPDESEPDEHSHLHDHESVDGTSFHKHPHRYGPDFPVSLNLAEIEALKELADGQYICEDGDYFHPLYGHGLIGASSLTADKMGGKRLYVINDKGRALLATQEPLAKGATRCENCHWWGLYFSGAADDETWAICAEPQPESRGAGGHPKRHEGDWCQRWTQRGVGSV